MPTTSGAEDPTFTGGDEDATGTIPAGTIPAGTIPAGTIPAGTIPAGTIAEARQGRAWVVRRPGVHDAADAPDASADAAPGYRADADVGPSGAGGAELAGLDALDSPTAGRAGALSPLGSAWSLVWPKVAALALGLGLWQVVVWAAWKPAYVLPGPVAVGGELAHMVSDGTLLQATVNTLVRAGAGFGVALVIGVVVGSLVARNRVLRSAFGSLITGLQTMPSIAWFPLAILLFQLSEKAILFVLVLGAAPAIANGLITGADQIPPILLRAGHVLGARGFAAWRHVVLPASLPGFVGGLKQGWAFAWRSLMAGELIVVIANKPSIGSVLQVRRNLADAEGLMATMVVILVIGILVDAAVFGRLERAVLRRWGLTGSSSR